LPCLTTRFFFSLVLSLIQYHVTFLHTVAPQVLPTVQPHDGMYWPVGCGLRCMPDADRASYGTVRCSVPRRCVMRVGRRVYIEKMVYVCGGKRGGTPLNKKPTCNKHRMGVGTHRDHSHHIRVDQSSTQLNQRIALICSSELCLPFTHCSRIVSILMRWTDSLNMTARDLLATTTSVFRVSNILLCFLRFLLLLFLSFLCLFL
jgi:hypothetical protein